MKRITDINLIRSLSMRRFLIPLVTALVLLSGFIETVNAADRMYWTDAVTRKIQRANLDGSGVVDLLVTGAAPQSIALDVAGGKMYWVEADGLKVRRANLDGSAVEDLVVAVGPAGIALDVAGGKMYWTDVFVTGSIQRANLDGSGVETLIPALCDCEGIALDVPGGKMYLTDRTFDRIRRANLDGSGLEDLVTTGLTDPRGIALDLTTGKMYWAEIAMLKIQRANLDGSGVEDLVTGLGNPSGIALDLTNGKMYWTNFGTHKIQRANLDGSGVEDLVAGLSIPVGIALELGPNVVTVAIDIKPGSFPNSVNPRSLGNIPVAILSTADFDAPNRVDKSSLTFGRTGDEMSLRSCALSGEDVNSDGLADLVCHFYTQQTGFQAGNTEGVLKGKTVEGTPLTGSNSVQIVPFQL